MLPLSMAVEETLQPSTEIYGSSTLGMGGSLPKIVNMVHGHREGDPEEFDSFDMLPMDFSNFDTFSGIVRNMGVPNRPTISREPFIQSEMHISVEVVRAR